MSSKIIGCHMKNISVALLIAVIILGARSANAQDAAGIFAIREDGTGLKELSKGHSGINQVRFSPDGSKLVFDAKVRDVPRPHCGGIAGQPPVNGKLFLMNNDGSDLHELRGYARFHTGRKENSVHTVRQLCGNL